MTAPHPPPPPAAPPAAPLGRTSRAAPRRALLPVLLLATTLAAMAASCAVAPGPGGLLAAALVPVLTAIAVIDGRRFIIPDALNGAALLLGLAHAVAVGGPDALPVAVARGAGLALLFLGLRVGYRALRGREGLGLGDVKLAGVAGVWLELAALPLAIELAALSALLAIATRQVLRGRALRGDGRLPFGLFLAPAIWIAWLLDHVLLDGAFLDGLFFNSMLQGGG